MIIRFTALSDTPRHVPKCFRCILEWVLVIYDGRSPKVPMQTYLKWCDAPPVLWSGNPLEFVYTCPNTPHSTPKSLQLRPEKCFRPFRGQPWRDLTLLPPPSFLNSLSAIGLSIALRHTPQHAQECFWCALEVVLVSYDGDSPKVPMQAYLECCDAFRVLMCLKGKSRGHSFGLQKPIGAT